MAQIIFKVNDDSPRIQYTTGAGATVFSYPFKIFVDSDLKVYLTPAGQQGNPTADILALNINYTVTNAGNINGGSVILTVPTSLNDTLTIVRDIPFDRQTDFTVEGAFTGAALNNEYDRIVTMAQQVRSLILDTGVTYEVTDPLTNRDENNILPILPAKVGGLIPIWSKNTENELVATSLEENLDVSSLRADLASQDMVAPGSELVGHYDTDNAIGRTVREQLDFLGDQIVVSAFNTGDIKANLTTSQIPGWVRLNDNTIGNPVSGATERANDDTEDLFVLLWNNVDDAFAPVSGGRGGNAQNDFIVGKTIQLMTTLGKVIQNQFGSGLTVGGLQGSTQTTLIVDNLPSHTHGVTDPGHNHNMNSRAVGSSGAALINGVQNGGGPFITSTEPTGITIDNTGSDQPFSNFQPSVAIPLHIKL